MSYCPEFCDKMNFSRGQEPNITKAICMGITLTVALPFWFMYQAATTLSKATLAKHTATKTTLPEDLHYDADKLFRLFIKPRIMVSNKRPSQQNSELNA